MGSQSRAVNTTPGCKMAGLNGFALHSLEDRGIEQQDAFDSLVKSDSLKDEILGLSNFSGRLERVLLALMRQQGKDRERLEGLSSALLREKEDRDREKEVAEEERAKDRETVAALERQLDDHLEGVRSELKVGLEDVGRGLEALEDRLASEVKRLEHGVRDLEQKCDEETQARKCLGDQLAEELQNAKTELEKDLERSRDRQREVQVPRGSLPAQLLPRGEENNILDQIATIFIYLSVGLFPVFYSTIFPSFGHLGTSPFG